MQHYLVEVNVFEKPKPTFKVKVTIEIDQNDPYGDKETGNTFEVRERENQEEEEESAITDMEQADMTEEEKEVLKDTQEEEETTKRSGRVISSLTRLNKEMCACSYEIGLSGVEQEYYNMMWKMSEMALVDAGIGGGFIDTNELHVMKYKEVMAGKDAEKWQKAVD